MLSDTGVGRSNRLSELESLLEVNIAKENIIMAEESLLLRDNEKFIKDILAHI